MSHGKKIISRRHPRYGELLPEWELFRQSYSGGSEYLRKNLFKFFVEGEKEFQGRLERAYRENHSERVVNLMNSYLFKEDATRKISALMISDWTENVDGTGKHIRKFMKDASQWAMVAGRIYVFVDRKALPGEQASGTNRDNIDPRTAPYLYRVMPQDMIDIAFSDDGKVKWCVVRETYRDDDDPFTAGDALSSKYRLWFGGEWILYDDSGDEISRGVTGLKAPPVVVVDADAADAYSGKSTISDIAYIDRAIFNNWSRLDAIVCGQTFSQLIFPIEGLPPEIIEDKTLRDKFMVLATNRVLLYSAMAQQPPSFISPDASQAQFILDMTLKQIKQLYAKVGMQAEVATETTAQSGVSKAYDFDKMNAVLATKADNLEHAEKQIIEIVKAWCGDIQCDVVIDYPDEFDVRSLIDEISIAESMASLGISRTFTAEVEKAVAMKALPKATPETMMKIFEEIERQDDAPDASQTVFPFDKQ